MSAGFYKEDNGGLLYAPEQVTGADFDLIASAKDTYTYPVHGWTWFDTEEQARLAYSIPAPPPMGTVVDVSSVPVWAMRVVLKRTGLFDTLNSYVEANKTTNIELWEVWNYGNYFSRTSPSIIALGPTFGLSSEQIDTLFRLAAQEVV